MFLDVLIDVLHNLLLILKAYSIYVHFSIWKLGKLKIECAGQLHYKPVISLIESEKRFLDVIIPPPITDKCLSFQHDIGGTIIIGMSYQPSIHYNSWCGTETYNQI